MKKYNFNLHNLDSFSYDDLLLYSIYLESKIKHACFVLNCAKDHFNNSDINNCIRNVYFILQFDFLNYSEWRKYHDYMVIN